MAKRRSKAQDALLGTIIVFCLIAWGISKAVNSVGGAAPVLIIAGGIALFVWIQRSKREARTRYLTDKYQDPRVVDLILRRNYWQGQTAAQLADSLGAPHSVDRKNLATRYREIWKYHHRGANRYGLRITLDDGIVSGWDHKQQT